MTSISGIVYNNNVAESVAKTVLGTGSYLINFKKNKDEWFSLPDGTKLPVYCNCRYIHRDPSATKVISCFLESTVRLNYASAELIVGLATAGIPWGSKIAERLDLPFAYVRNSVKGYGSGRLVECAPKRGLKAVIIDDVCFSGESIIKSISALKSEFDIKTIGVVVIVGLSSLNYEENVWSDIRSTGATIHALTDYGFILDEALNRGVLDKNQVNLMHEYYKSPKSYIWK